jgi:hypothetical protein
VWLWPSRATGGGGAALLDCIHHLSLISWAEGVCLCCGDVWTRAAFDFVLLELYIIIIVCVRSLIPYLGYLFQSFFILIVSVIVSVRICETIAAGPMPERDYDGPAFERLVGQLDNDDQDFNGMVQFGLEGSLSDHRAQRLGRKRDTTIMGPLLFDFCIGSQQRRPIVSILVGIRRVILVTMVATAGIPVELSSMS